MFLRPQLAFGDRLELASSAHRRSKELFETLVSPEQLTAWRAKKEFTVMGGITGRRYLLKSLRSHNMSHYDINSGQSISFCAAPGKVPFYDALAGQVLWLQSDGELEFLSQCNIRVSGPKGTSWHHAGSVSIDGLRTLTFPGTLYLPF